MQFQSIYFVYLLTQWPVSDVVLLFDSIQAIMRFKKIIVRSAWKKDGATVVILLLSEIHFNLYQSFNNLVHMN